MQIILEIQSRHRSHMFFGNVSISRGRPTTCNTDNLTDRELYRICKSTLMGTIRSSVPVEDILSCMANEEFKAVIQESLDRRNKRTENNNETFKDVEDVKVEIEEVVTEEEVEPEVEDEAEVEEAEEEETEGEPESTDAENYDNNETTETLNLGNILLGTVAEIRAVLADVELSDEQKLELIELEEAGKNRSSVLDLIS